MDYIHCDVFANQPYAGNSLAVFTSSDGLSGDQMLAITQELRHFETIFLRADDVSANVSARIFDLNEELPFAGHPILGAASVLHWQHGETGKVKDWSFDLSGRAVNVRSERTENGIRSLMNQGRPEFLNTLSEKNKAEFAKVFNLEENDLSADLPLEVVSTGLKYLIVPLRRGIDRARIVTSDLEGMLHEAGAEFAYLFDVERFEGRHWNNDGIVEDIATGSAAGTVGSYALRHSLVSPGAPFILHQGQHAGRPSEIGVIASGSPSNVQSVEVSGNVTMVGKGSLLSLPGMA